jgi:phosphatidylglycerophosphate synthase
MARYSGETSKLGAALDKASDAIVELALVLGIAFVDPEQRMWGLIVVVSYVAMYNLFFAVVGYKLF